jgi:hypothetical protein
MPDTIKAGTILIKERTSLRGSLPLGTRPFSRGWRLLGIPGGQGVERMVREAGWEFFFMAGKIKAISLGVEREKRTRRAAFNCVEFTQVIAKRFLGLPYVCVTAHSRHIQKGNVFSSDETEHPAPRCNGLGPEREPGVEAATYVRAKRR